MTNDYALPHGRANAPFAAERGFIDKVIEPAQTGSKLIRALALLENKRDQTRPRSTGTFRCDQMIDIKLACLTLNGSATSFFGLGGRLGIP